ncbi:glycogen synthase [Thalassotalea maritima]|uniref:glycogen synthase n=1 Tax=Thalassotalea maritima TaxID=3242416 RepID=UPI00352893AE
MRILMVASENDALPRGKVGGIGDVIRDIPKFLVKQGMQVDVITPGYQYHAFNNPSKHLHTLYVPFRESIEAVDLYQLTEVGDNNVRHFVLESKLFCTDTPGKIYHDDGHDKPFYSDANKFALFCAATCELLIDAWHEQYDVLHLHDWHSALVAILSHYEPRYQSIKDIRSVYSIHNLAIQGIRPLHATQSSLHSWFPTLSYDSELIADPRYIDCLNPTRAAINLVDSVHVVSPTYRQEVMLASDPSRGFIGGEGLEADLQNAAAQNRLVGILNGCDYDSTFPEPVSSKELITLILQRLQRLHGSDEYVKAAHYLAEQRCQDWQTQKTTGPLVISVGRLTGQKVQLLFEPGHQGIIIDDVLKLLAKFGGRMIVLGSGDSQLEQRMTQVMQRHNNLLFINGFCAGLAEHLYVNGDVFFMPSSFEPCGISQMQAMRAGMPVIAHQIGGLNDTITHLDTGFLFSGNSIIEQTDDLLTQVELALQMFKNSPADFAKMCKHAKAQRFYWDACIKQYISELYQIQAS